MKTNKPHKSFNFFLLISVLMMFMGVREIYYALTIGPGIWTLSDENQWGVAISNFVFWIGVGHAGTLISAIFFLTKSKKHFIDDKLTNGKTSISSLAETITICALAVAVVNPIIHLGRPWLLWYMLPLFNPSSTSALWPQISSPLVWDFFAILAYAVLSIAFWRISMVKRRAHEFIMSLLSIVMIFLVLNVHSIVSYDFAVTLNPYWNKDTFPLLFIVGALYSGFAFLNISVLVYLYLWPKQNHIKAETFSLLNKIIYTMSIVMAIVFIQQIIVFVFEHQSLNDCFIALKSNSLCQFYAIIFICLVIVPQLLLNKKFRNNHFVILIINMVILTALWFERLVIIREANLINDWGKRIVDLSLNKHDWMLSIGALGAFATMLLLLMRFVLMKNSTKSILEDDLNMDQIASFDKEKKKNLDKESVQNKFNWCNLIKSKKVIVITTITMGILGICFSWLILILSQNDFAWILNFSFDELQWYKALPLFIVNSLFFMGSWLVICFCVMSNLDVDRLKKNKKNISKSTFAFIIMGAIITGVLAASFVLNLNHYSFNPDKIIGEKGKYSSYNDSLWQSADSLVFYQEASWQSGEKSILKPDIIVSDSLVDFWLLKMNSDSSGSLTLNKASSEIYQQYCALCHGDKAQGSNPSLDDVYPPSKSLINSKLVAHTNLHYWEYISLGRANMPGFNERLSKKEVWQIIAYLRKLQRDFKLQEETLKNNEVKANGNL